MNKSIGISVFFGLVSFIIAVSLGSVLTVSTGIPLIGGLTNGILTGMVLTIGLLSRKFNFNATTMWLSFSLAASFTTTLGPPGLYKIAIGLLAGLIWDVFYISLYNKNKTLGLYLGGLIGSASIMFSLVAFLKLGFGENATVALEKYESQFLIILVMNLIITFIGIYLGSALFKTRLSKLSHFKNISNQ